VSDASVLLKLENEHLRFRLYDDASGELEDIKAGTQWRMGQIATQEYGPIYDPSVAIFYRVERAYAEEYPGRFRGERRGEAVRFTVLGRLDAVQGGFTCRYRLDGPWLEVRIEEIDEELPSLVFPTPLESENLVVPTLSVGRLVREPIRARYFWSAFGDLSMRWFGGLRGDAGWIGIFTEGYTDAGVHVLGLSACPGWLKSLGKWRGPRAIRYRMTENGYVGMARAYRDWAREKGLHKTLREKIEQTPKVKNLIGGRVLGVHQAMTVHTESFEELGVRVPPQLRGKEGQVVVSCTHEQLAKIVAEARQAGMTRGVVNVRGWIRGGYDESHPDIWPPEPALGGVDELRALMTESPLGALHDNYQDIYQHCPSFPKGIMRQPNGEYCFGGLWDGGQAYLLCSSQMVARARENWEKMRRHLNPSAIFVDTTTASPLYECYDGDHPLSRADDEKHKLRLVEVFKSGGVVFGTEEGRDFPMPLVDWYENRYLHSPGESIPLWPLVYHDAAVITRYLNPTGADLSGHGAANWLADMLWGSILFWAIRSPQDWRRIRDDFRRTFHVDKWHERIGLDEMRNHEYLTDDFLVEKTEFSSGSAIVANFSAEARAADGVTVPAGGYVILD